MGKKQELGQFYTKKYKYILSNLKIPEGVSIIEPFAGEGDLLNFVKNRKEVECYDIDPKKKWIKKRDTLKDPPKYKNKFIITNPPYLARNKSDSKEIFDLYDQNDLYKCFLISLIQGKCMGGIIIIPLNFWSSIRMSDIKLRQLFLSTYDVKTLNIFEERVFDDTSYTICSFQFEKKKQSDKFKSIKTHIYPSKNIIYIKLNVKNNFTIGGELYNLPQDSSISVERSTKHNYKSKYTTNIVLKCIDDNLKSQIRLFIGDKDKYCDNTAKLSNRSYALLVINKKMDKDDQKELVDDFNKFLNKKRKKYNSLFLTNYRESNTIARKRISFKLGFEIVNYLLSE